MDSFLFDNGLRHERVNTLQSTLLWLDDKIYTIKIQNWNYEIKIELSNFIWKSFVFFSLIYVSEAFYNVGSFTIYV